MLHYALLFFVVAIIAAVFGFGGIAAGAAGIAKVLFVLFLIFGSRGPRHGPLQRITTLIRTSCHSSGWQPARSRL